MDHGLEPAGSGADDPGIVPGLAPGAASAGRPAGGPSSPPFDVVLRGYHRGQVDAVHADLRGRLDELTAALEVARQREATALAAAERTTAELERGRPSFDTLGERVAEMLRLAEAEAADMRTAAERDAAALRESGAREADELRRTAEREVDSLRHQWADVLAQISAARDGLEAILAGSRTIDITDATTAGRHAGD